MPDLENATSGLRAQLEQHLCFLYPDLDASALIDEMFEIFDGFPVRGSRPSGDLWSQQDCLLITYGDSIADVDEAPLKTLHRFLNQHLSDVMSAVHILPFCPFSSDDGFAVIDYNQVDPKLGDWSHIGDMAGDYRLMADIVINHVSSQSDWFQNYGEGVEPGASYFIEAGEDEDLSEVVRPRASPLLRPTQTPDGIRHVWCTFSHDQVDLNFRNPSVLMEFLKVIRLYVEHGVSIFRLDAVGFLWKEPGTSCMHLPQTHEVVRLLRTIVDAYQPGTLLITETNVPNHENLTYFGNQNEAHVIYNFSLAPLLLHALLSGKTDYLKRWMMSMPPAPQGCTYLNFTASHDGIGMRPAEGLLSEEEQSQLVDTIGRFGGRVSTRRTSDGGQKVYELNIALFDACQGTIDGKDEWQVQRFLCSQTVMLGLEGIPAFYIHSLLAASNDLEGVASTGQSRSINRRKWRLPVLQQLLDDEASPNHDVFIALKNRIRLRRRQPAFNPNATQFTLHLSDQFFAFWRQSTDRRQSVFCVHNMTKQTVELRLADLNLISTDRWTDLISGDCFEDQNGVVNVQPYQALWITNRQH